MRESICPYCEKAVEIEKNKGVGTLAHVHDIVFDL